ncbi:hypothetical protein CUMW_127560 [Citrus unshiu]|uniref:Uncharacterized protein n=1 Tax=Citrus unshiu TaxID=55188 RepID=A0A2H5PDX5_CITUN|nr:hypothetical protein CUMW_127560 [Citrus unshiu]
MRKLLILPLHFPGPKLEACTPHFPMSADELGRFWCIVCTHWIVGQLLVKSGRFSPHVKLAEQTIKVVSISPAAIASCHNGESIAYHRAGSILLPSNFPET